MWAVLVNALVEHPICMFSPVWGPVFLLSFFSMLVVLVLQGIPAGYRRLAGPREWERVSNVLVESVLGRVWQRVGSCPGLLYRVIFKRTPLAYCGVSSLGHSGSQFGPISCTHVARFAQNQRMIALRLMGSAKKNRESGGGIVEKWKTEIGWHVQPSLLEFKGLAGIQF